jgi:hypothetical protein
MSNEPTPIGPEIAFVIKRTALLKAHADAVLEVRDRAARVRCEMIAHEVRIMAMDGLSPRLAEVAARNNLAVRLRDLDNELVSELSRLQEQLRRRLSLLLEELEDERS